MQALLIVDVQNDFLPGGALAVPHGDEVVDIANQLMPKYELVIATQDWHPADHLSFASQHPGWHVGDVIDLDGQSQVLWPDHCVQRTAGAGFASALDVAGVHHVVRKGLDRRVDSYSAFFDNGHRHATGLLDFLHARGVTDLHVLGLATDYCVKFTVLDARAAGLPTTVLTAACRGVNLNPHDTHAALSAMREAGATIT